MPKGFQYGTFQNNAFQMNIRDLSATDGLKGGESYYKEYYAKPTATDGFKLAETLSHVFQAETSILDGFKLADSLLSSQSIYNLLASDTFKIVSGLKICEYWDTGIYNWGYSFNYVYWVGQTFTALSNHPAYGASIYLSKSSSPAPSGRIYAEIFATSGMHPTGSALCSGSVLISSVTYVWITILFDSPMSLVSGTKYALVLRAPDATEGTLNWKNDIYAGYSGGNVELSSDSGLNWTSVNYDFLFKIIGGIPPTIGMSYATLLADGLKLTDSDNAGLYYLLASVDGLKLADSNQNKLAYIVSLIDGFKTSDLDSLNRFIYLLSTDGIKIAESISLPGLALLLKVITTKYQNVKPGTTEYQNLEVITNLYRVIKKAISGG